MKPNKEADLRVRVELEIKEEIEKIAEIQGIKPAEWIRNACKQQLPIDKKKIEIQEKNNLRKLISKYPQETRKILSETEPEYTKKN